MLSRRAVLSAVPAALAIAAAPTGVATAASGRRPGATGPGSPAGMDPTVWREYGTPLVTGCQGGPLRGETIAVKDLFSVAGHRIGAGNEAWLAQAEVETTTAPAVAKLLRAGADIAGIARTDEFAYSLAGTNAHHGIPPNAGAPHRISGGSTSGPASAVGLGHASIALGTDTGGSVRIPAAYQGLYGIRTTHGAVPTTGVLPLAPSFDTVGWLTRDAALLARVGEVLLPPSTPQPIAEIVVVPELLALAEADVAARVGAFARALGAVEESWDLAGLPAWCEAFRVHQAAEAWAAHAGWLRDRLDTLGPGIRSRFEAAAAVTPQQAARARGEVVRARDEIRALVDDRVIALPSAPSVAPRVGEDAGRLRDATMLLTCLAGLGGLPAVSVPVATEGEPPVGACLVAAAGRDRDLLTFVTDRDERLRR